LKQKIDNKNNLRKRSLIDQEQQLALEMLTTETAHARRVRENTLAKKHQAKVRATKTQQELPVNMVINNRLLICKVKGELYLYAKPALRVGPYIQVLISSQ
jgi:hypothetical protein